MIMILHAMPANCLDTNKTYTISEAALIIHVSPHVLRRWESEGYVLSSIRTEFGRRRYTEEDIQNLMRHKEVVNNIEYVSNRELETKGPLLIATETAKIRKLNTKFALGTLGLVFFLIASFFTIKIRSGIQSIYKGLTVGNLTSHPAVASNVLAAGASIADYIFTVNSSTIFARDVKVNDKVTITGQATLSGGITTNNANIDIGTGTIRASNLTLSGLGDVSGILSVDAISKKTLEKTLDIGGDVNGTGLNNVKLKKNFIDENYLASSIDYDGDLTLSGTLDITGTYAIGGTTVTVTAEELNSLGGLTGDISDLNMLDGTTAATGGVMFGNGTIITQDSDNLSWDDTNNRLGVGTPNPTTTLDVAGSVKLGSAVSDVVTIAGSLATGSSITPATDLGSDLGSNNKRFNNLWVANINSNESTNLGGQTILTYAPTDTTYTQSSLMLNPTAPAANGYLTGWGVAGYQKAGMDAEGDLRVGYTGDVSIPASDNPFEIYGHNTTKVMTVDTGGNTALSGNLAIDTSTLFVDAGNNRIGYFDATPLSMIDYNLNFNLDNRGNNTLTYGGTVYNTDIYRKNISLTATTNINSSWSYDMLDLFNIEIPASTTADLSRGFIQGRTLLFNNNTGGKSPLIIGDSVTVANRPTGSAANSVYGQSVNISNYANPSISQFFGRTGSAYQYGPGTVSELYGISNYTAPTTASVSNNAAASTVYGIYNAAFTEGITSGYTASATNLYADRNLAYASARNGGTSTIGTGAYGGRFLVFANGDASSIASINNGYGVYASVGAYGHATNSIMTNAYGVYVSNGINASPRGAITNNYALYIEDQTQGLAQNFSIYSAGGKNYFGGNVGIGTTNPSAKLQITQTTISNPSIRLLFNEDVYGSDNVFEVKTNTNAIKVAVTEAGSLISNSIGSSYTTTVGGLAGTFSSGNNITALGYRAAYAASSKNYITAVGVDTGYYNRGNYFTGYGYNAGAAAGSYTSTGDYVTSIGAFAGAQSRVDNVTALGYSSGYQNSAHIRDGISPLGV